MPYILCECCFEKEQNNCDSHSRQHLIDRNYGLYIIPFVNIATAIIKGIEYGAVYHDGYIYYIRHGNREEKYSHRDYDSADAKPCSRCGSWNGKFYQYEGSSEE